MPELPYGEGLVTNPVHGLPHESVYEILYAHQQGAKTTTTCAYGGIVCHLPLLVQDNEIVKVISPHDDVRIKGHFGFQHVQQR